MRGSVRGFVVGALGLAVLISSPATSFALPKKYTTQCKCTCIAYDELGKRHEGGTYTFTTDTDTPGPDCTIGITVGCSVGALKLKGAYASCTGKDITKAGTATRTPGGTGGVLQRR
jgi:hypothetical protein